MACTPLDSGAESLDAGLVSTYDLPQLPLNIARNRRRLFGAEEENKVEFRFYFDSLKGLGPGSITDVVSKPNP